MAKETTSEPVSGAPEAPLSERERIIGEKRESCVPFFDALWFCYSPVHQMKEYYTYGTVDDCTGHWGTLMDCLKRKTEKYKEEAAIDPNAAKHPLWQLRTGLEAKEFWRHEFSKDSDNSGNTSNPIGGVYGRMGGTSAAGKKVGTPDRPTTMI